jgi:hypothetical protein
MTMLRMKPRHLRHSTALLLAVALGCGATKKTNTEASTSAAGGANQTSSQASQGGSGGSGGSGGMASSSMSGSGGINFSGVGGSFMATDVEVIMTADNAYGFGYGNETTMLNYFGGVVNKVAGEIFNCNGPETYTVPAQDADIGNFIYIIGYADKSTTQGVIGQFTRVGGMPVYTGSGDWEVCATGKDFNSPGSGPSLVDINAEIPKCNAGTGDPATTSAGWVDANGTSTAKLQIGEDNTTPRMQVTPGNEFPIACGIDDDARWMWFNWNPTAIQWPTQSPFIWPGGSANPGKEFLIFRLRAEAIPVEPR